MAIRYFLFEYEDNRARKILNPLALGVFLNEHLKEVIDVDTDIINRVRDVTDEVKELIKEGGLDETKIKINQDV